MIDLTNEKQDTRVTRLIEALDALKGAGAFEFVLNENPEPVLQAMWKERTGKFQCVLLDRADDLWRVQVSPKQSCCGHCC